MTEQTNWASKLNEIGRWLFGLRPPRIIAFEGGQVQLGPAKLAEAAWPLSQPQEFLLFDQFTSPLLLEIGESVLARPDLHTITLTELELSLPPEMPLGLTLSLLLDVPGRYQFAANLLLELPSLSSLDFKPSPPAMSNLGQRTFNWSKSTPLDLTQLLHNPDAPTPGTEDLFYLLTGQTEPSLPLPDQYTPAEQLLLTLELLDLAALISGGDTAPDQPALSEFEESRGFFPAVVEPYDLVIPTPMIYTLPPENFLAAAATTTVDLFQLLTTGRVLGKNYDAEAVIKSIRPATEDTQASEQGLDICVHGLLSSTCDICNPSAGSSKRGETGRSKRPGSSRRPGSPPVINVFDLLLPYLQPPIDAVTDWSIIFPPKKSLYNFQVTGSHFLVTHKAALLADEMGLGKSVQAIFALRILFRRSRKPMTTLILSPKSVLKDWEKKLEEWAPDLRVITIDGPPAMRTALWQTSSHVYLAGYDTLTADSADLPKTNFDVIILDEIQVIKNPSTKRTKAVRKIEAEWRWGLSATPLENHPDDLVSIFAYLKPGLLTYEDAQNRTRLKNKITPYMLRRRIRDVQDSINLKEPIYNEVWLELTSEQRQRYNEVLGKARQALKPLAAPADGQAAGRTDFEIKRRVLAEITELKKICNFDPVSGKSCKAEYLQQKLPGICEVNEKALIFSQYPNISLQPLAGTLKRFKPDLFDGSLSNAKRDEKIQEFQESSQTQVLLMSVKAGGVGITLTRANHVFFLDQWWNPATGKQAIGRAYRIGQKKTVYVTSFCVANTIEERIRRILERKQHLFDEIIDDQSEKIYQTITVEELFEVLGMVQYDAILKDTGRAIGRTIQIISEITGLNDYQKARQLVQKLPATILKNVSRDQAEQVKQQLAETSGARVDIQARYT